MSMRYSFKICDEEGFLIDSFDLGYGYFKNYGSAEQKAVDYCESVISSCARQYEQPPRGLEYEVMKEYEVGDVIVGVFNRCELKVVNISKDEITGVKMIKLLNLENGTYLYEPYRRMQDSAFELKEV